MHSVPKWTEPLWANLSELHVSIFYRGLTGTQIGGRNVWEHQVKHTLVFSRKNTFKFEYIGMKYSTKSENMWIKKCMY